MHKDEYIEYLKSDDWKERRKYLLEIADNICAKCGEKAKILHHLNYDNLGDEQIDIDVIAVCKDCHDEIHEIGVYGYGEHKGY